MTQFGEEIVQKPQYTVTSNPKFFEHELAAGIANLPFGFQALNFQRSLASAPELTSQFDDRAQAIYAGLNPKTVFFPLTQQAKYPNIPEDERAEIAQALNDHGSRSLRLARETLRLANVEWLGLASRDGGAVIDRGEVSNLMADKVPDDLGYIRRLKATDFAVVGPKTDVDSPLSLAMGAADCLAIPLVDRVTGAFGLTHAGRPGTGLRTAEQTVGLLRSEFRSNPKDLVAWLGEGVCPSCYDVDETTFTGFVADFGGRTAIDKVVSQYPKALATKETPTGKRVGIDLYAFNKYLLAEQGVGTIIMAPNCTARLSVDCPTLGTISWKDTVPTEAEQAYYSHARVKGQAVGWTMHSGDLVELDTFHLGTPRNLATVTRL